jgi:hypothetical protein
MINETTGYQRLKQDFNMHPELSTVTSLEKILHEADEQLMQYLEPEESAKNLFGPVRLRMDKLEAIIGTSELKGGKIVHKMGDIRTLTQAQIDSFEPTEEETVHAKYMIAIRLVSPKLERLDPEIRNKYYCRACRS